MEVYNERLGLLKRLVAELQRLRLEVKSIDDKYHWTIKTLAVMLKVLFTFNINQELFSEMFDGKSVIVDFNEFSEDEIENNFAMTGFFFGRFISSIESRSEIIEGEEI